MPNSGRRVVQYKPRMSDYEAYELLPPSIQKALQEALQEWDSYTVYRKWKKRNCNNKSIVDMIKIWDTIFMSKGWIVKRGRGVNVMSSFIECKVKPLYANWW